MPLFGPLVAAASKFTARLQASTLKTVANTAAETSIFPSTITGSKTIPAAFWADGASVRLLMRGKCATRTLTPGTLTVKVKLGATTVVTTTTGSLLGGGSGNFSVVLTVIYNATDKVLRGAGKLEVPPGLITVGRVDLITPDAGIAWTTPADADIDVTAQWSAADPANTITGVVATVEQLTP